MKLKDLINHITALCSAVPNVSTTYAGSIYDLNALETVKYGAMVITQGEHTQLNRDIFVAKLHLFFVDREDPTASNRIDIQSHAIDVLRNILAQLEDDLDVEIGTATYNTFRDRFQAVCSGAFVSFTVTFPLSDCADNYQ